MAISRTAWPRHLPNGSNSTHVANVCKFCKQLHTKCDNVKIECAFSCAEQTHSRYKLLQRARHPRRKLIHPALNTSCGSLCSSITKASQGSPQCCGNDDDEERPCSCLRCSNAHRTSFARLARLDWLYLARWAHRAAGLMSLQSAWTPIHSATSCSSLTVSWGCFSRRRLLGGTGKRWSQPLTVSL